MKIFLDDLRDPPDDSWTVVRSPIVCLTLIMMNLEEITHISFDHDLGYVSHVTTNEFLSNLGLKLENGKEVTGYDVLCALECLQAHGHDFNIIMTVHSANPVGIEKMNKLIENIKKRE